METEITCKKCEWHISRGNWYRASEILNALIELKQISAAEVKQLRGKINTLINKKEGGKLMQGFAAKPYTPHLSPDVI